MKFLKTFVLTSWLFPYSCHKCGSDYKKIGLNDLPPNIRAKHIAAGTAWLIDAYVYQCPNSCDGPDKAVMIM